MEKLNKNITIINGNCDFAAYKDYNREKVIKAVNKMYEVSNGVFRKFVINHQIVNGKDNLVITPGTTYKVF